MRIFLKSNCLLGNEPQYHTIPTVTIHSIFTIIFSVVIWALNGEE